MTRFEHAKEILDAAVAGTTIHAHGAFWRGLSRDGFVQKIVFTLPLISVGDGKNSNLIHALRGEEPFGNDTGNDDARFPRMPAGLPPVAEADIEFIEKWIDDGCPEDEYVPPAAGGVAAMVAAGDASVHLSYWRNLDEWSLNHRPPGVEEAIGEVFGRSFLWKRMVRQANQESAWDDALAEPPARPAWELLAGLQAQTVRSFYGTEPDWDLVLESYTGFGAGILPPDALRPSDPQHQMNGAGMWFQWSAFADGAVRLAIEPEFWRQMMRVILVGMLNDGLVRGRFAVTGFDGAAPSPAILAHVKGLQPADLPGALARRFIESGLA